MTGFGTRAVPTASPTSWPMIARLARGDDDRACADTRSPGGRGAAPAHLLRHPASGVIHLGNELGAIRNYVRLQYEYEAIYCIVDYHAPTSTHEPDLLRARTRDMAAGLLALGLDPERCTLFVQSHRPEHTELAWLLATVTPVSWLERTPTYKEKKQSQPHDINHGLLTYPVLQAGDIVIYKASLVPVGKDQAAHLELSREIVRAFNSRYGDTFPNPRRCSPRRPSSSARTACARCRSRSEHDRRPRRPGTIRKQIMSMVTDTKRILRTDPAAPRSATSASSTVSSVMTSRRSGTASGRGRAASIPSGCSRSGSSATTRLPASGTSSCWRTRARSRDPRDGRRPPAPDGRGDDGRGPPADGSPLASLPVPWTERRRTRRPDPRKGR